jgi:2-polyprenyl-3-methyl-5-hydroxy-6-metoxy-1,4-benzoquinol methylase
MKSEKTIIQSVEKSQCILCNSSGALLYENLVDKVFNSPGMWSLKQCINSKCRLVWLDPMPIPEDIYVAYQNYYTHYEEHKKQSFLKKINDFLCKVYIQEKMGYEVGVRAPWSKCLMPFAYLHPAGLDRIQSRVMFLNSPKDKTSNKLLEIGCGNGQKLKVMQALGWNVTGIDFDSEAVKTAQRNGLCVQEGELVSQKYADNSFDAIYMGHLIEHIYNPQETLRECFRLLKNNGKLMILTPNVDSWGHQKYKNAWRGLEPPRHIHLFNQSNMVTLLTSIGYQRIEATTLTQGAAYILGMSQEIKSSSSRSIYSKKNRCNLVSKFLGFGYQLWERYLNSSRTDIGEEILISASKF